MLWHLYEVKFNMRLCINGFILSNAKWLFKKCEHHYKPVKKCFCCFFFFLRRSFLPAPQCLVSPAALGFKQAVCCFSNLLATAIEVCDYALIWLVEKDFLRRWMGSRWMRCMPIKRQWGADSKTPCLIKLNQSHAFLHDLCRSRCHCVMDQLCVQ